MIRFSAALVVVAIGVLVGGMASSSLLLVYVAIGLSMVALLTLAFGVALKREEIFGEQGQAPTGTEAASAERSAVLGRQQDAFGQQVAFGQSAPAPRTGAGVHWPPLEVKVGAAPGRSATLTCEDPAVEDGAPGKAADSDRENRPGQREVTVVPGVPRYHDANCILIRFMGDDDLEKMTLDEAAEAGSSPCRACMAEYA